MVSAKTAKPRRRTNYGESMTGTRPPEHARHGGWDWRRVLRSPWKRLWFAWIVLGPLVIVLGIVDLIRGSDSLDGGLTVLAGLVLLVAALVTTGMLRTPRTWRR